MKPQARNRSAPTLAPWAGGRSLGPRRGWEIKRPLQCGRHASTCGGQLSGPITSDGSPEAPSGRGQVRLGLGLTQTEEVMLFDSLPGRRLKGLA